jgi:hypothetical protein
MSIFICIILVAICYAVAVWAVCYEPKSKCIKCKHQRDEEYCEHFEEQ